MDNTTDQALTARVPIPLQPMVLSVNSCASPNGRPIIEDDAVFTASQNMVGDFRQERSRCRCESPLSCRQFYTEQLNFNHYRIFRSYSFHTEKSFNYERCGECQPRSAVNPSLGA